MSIITTAAAVPSRLLSIYAALAESENGQPRDRIEAWSTPPSLSTRAGGGDEEEGSTTLFSTALQEAIHLGLVEVVDDRLRVPAEARGTGRKGDREDEFRSYVMRTLFDPPRAAQARQDGFMLALAWFLTKSPLRPLSFSEPPQNLLRADLGDRAEGIEIGNLNRYQSFLYWAWYLGFATIVGDGVVRRALPDPARAIAAVLPTVFAEQAEWPIDVFMARLSAILPVFEGGSVRQELEAMRLTPTTESADRLSPATSIALQRLADRRRIALAAVADANPRRILDHGVARGLVTHVRRGSGT